MERASKAGKRLSVSCLPSVFRATMKCSLEAISYYSLVCPSRHNSQFFSVIIQMIDILHAVLHFDIFKDYRSMSVQIELLFF